MENIQIYYGKKNFDVQKAERFFKERGVKYQACDLLKRPMGRRELEALVNCVGLEGAIDQTSKAYLECPARFSGSDTSLLNALANDQRMLRTPIVRFGRHFSVGYAPEIWQTWLK